jgi:hypothetical protein
VVSEDRPVEVGINGFATIQPYLAAHPQNAAHLVGSVILADKAIAVNRKGVVGISWYDGRNDARGYRHNFRV